MIKGEIEKTVRTMMEAWRVQHPEATESEEKVVEGYLRRGVVKTVLVDIKGG